MKIDPNHLRQFVIVGIGEILWDLLPTGKRLGGAPANVVFHVHNLGAEGYIVSRVGNDPFGEKIMSNLKSLGLSRRYISIDKTRPTGSVSVSLDSKGIPCYIIHDDVAWDYIAFSQGLSKLASLADAVCYGSLGQRSKRSQDTIRRFLRHSRKSCLRIFDINLRHPYYSKAIIAYLLKLSNVLKINEEELSVVAQLLSIQGGETKILQVLLERFSLDLVALTRGERGSLLFSQGRESVHPGYPVEVKDTVGAGDSFTAALMLGLLEGHDLDRINENANRLASNVCTQDGAWSKLSTNFYG
ncbi:MAG: carbohydrate kinase [Candidatus Aminicenantes bacterium]|nr:MAG: carbohydrate kinase [Candidatus Aminicenantes bacterium]